MTVVSSLIAFGLRQVVGDCADQVVDVTGQFVPYAGPIYTAIRKRLTDHGQTLPAALCRANDRAWQAVGLALAGDGLLDRVKDVFRDGDLKGVRDQIKKFLDQTPTGMESASPNIRSKAIEEWRRLRKSARLSPASLPSDELANQAAALDRYSDPTRLTAAAHRAAVDTATAVKDQAPHLAQLLTAAPPDGAPLLAVAFAFFFRRELETNAELFRGLASDTLRRLSERQEHGFAELETSLGAQTGRVLDRLDQLFDALDERFDAIGADLKYIRAKMDQIIDQRDVPTSTSKPLIISVTNKSELELLQSLRNQLRALPPEMVAAADWSKLGDTLAAAGQFPEAGEAHQAAAAAAKAAADRTAEAEAEYKQFRDACEAGDRMAALTAFRRAVELDPERFTPFDLHRYQPQAVLGAGGFGVVFLADDLYVRVGDKRQPQRVAIKAVHNSGWDAILDRDLSETFDEADTLSALNHPGIVKTLNRGFGDPARQKRPYLVLEYFGGPTLDAWLKAKGTLPLPHVLRIARQIAEAVHQAHKRRIYHRDIKPANVMASFDKTARRWHVKVIDFGLAVKLHVAQKSMGVPSGRRTALDRSMAGTLRYAPPEQRNELDVPVGPYSDVYAFGKTCLDLLFGTTEPKMLHWKTLPEESREQVQDLFERATIDNLEYRFPNFEPVLTKLAELLGGAKAHVPTKETLEAAPVPAAWATPTPTPSAAQPRLPSAQPLPGHVTTVLIAGPTNSEMKFAWCPPGTFLMGGNGQTDNPQHRVTITKGFWMGVYPVTQAQWQAVMGHNPSNFPGADRPVEMVSWYDCQEFCQKMAELTGKPIQLPTEAEWEYACRAGTTGEYFNGNGEDALKKVGWYGENSGIQSHVVGEKKVANPWGLFDVHGNVWEWCRDLYAALGSENIKDPINLNNGDARVLRGGSSGSDPEPCRATFRYWSAPGAGYNSGLRVGFRLD